MDHDRRRLIRAALIGLLAVAVAAGVTLAVLFSGAPVGPAAVRLPTASPTPAATSASSSPSASPTTRPVTVKITFNNPWGKLAQQRSLLTAQIAAIRKAPKGSTITILAYSISDIESAVALRRAKERGVKVRVLLSDHAHYPYGRYLGQWLGSDTGKRSYLVRCHLACGSDVTYPNEITGTTTRPYQHAKAMAISRSGSDKWVVMVPSGNLTRDSTENQANDLLVVRNDKALYDFIVDRFDVMRKDRGGTAGSVDSGSVGMRLYPDPPTVPRSGVVPSPKPTDDPYAALFDDITCVVGGNRTRIDIAMYIWTEPRRYLATQVAALSAAGCDVRAIGTPVAVGRDGKVWDPQIRKALLARGDVELWQIDVGSDRVLHTKTILIDGWDAAGNRITRTYGGSPNFVAQALFWSDELAWWTTDPAVLAAERDWMDQVLLPHSRRLN